MKNSKLTSVKIIESLYNKFKKSSVGTDMTLQKLTNRSIDLYLLNSEYRNNIENYTNLIVSGSNL